MQNLNSGKLQTALASYQARMKTYLDTNKPNATVGEVLGKKTIVAEELPYLMGGLPYKTLAVGGKYSSWPSALRWKIKLNMYDSALAKASGSPLLTTSLALSRIGSKRLAAVYRAATPADQAVIDRYKGSPQLPVYLVNQKLAIQLDDQVLTEYGAQRMGSDQYWTYTLSIPGVGDFEEDFKYVSSVGDQIIFGVDGNGLSTAMIAQRYQMVSPDSSLENLQHISLGYWARADVADQLSAQSTGVVTYRQPSVGLFAQPLSVLYSFGIPRLGSYKSYAVDIRRLSASASPLAGGSAKDFIFQSGIQNSFLEGRIFQEVFDDAAGIGQSAVAVMNAAVNNGKPIWHIDNTNLNQYQAVSTLSTEIKNQIAGAVATGHVVLAPEALADAGFWQAEGYIATDPDTGAGAYILKSTNGGEFENCEESSEPLTKSLSDQIKTFMVMALLIALIAAGVGGSGGAGGVLVPAGSSALQEAMAAVGVTSLVWSTTSAAAGKCNTKGCHRGVFQAQGADITDGKGTGKGLTKSEAWSLPMPLRLAPALGLLSALQAKLTPAQLRERVGYFADAEAYIRRLAASGGACAPIKPESFGPDNANKEHVKNGIRVDVLIITGEAFVP